MSTHALLTLIWVWLVYLSWIAGSINKRLAVWERERRESERDGQA